MARRKYVQQHHLAGAGQMRHGQLSTADRTTLAHPCALSCPGSSRPERERERRTLLRSARSEEMQQSRSGCLEKRVTDSFQFQESMGCQ